MLKHIEIKLKLKRVLYYVKSHAESLFLFCQLAS